MVCFASNAEAQTVAGLRVESSTTFEPDPDQERIDVRATFTMTNLQADEVFGDSVRSYFFTKWVVALPANAIDFAATSAGGALTTTVEADEDSEDVVFGTISLPFNLRFRQTVQVDVSYTIPGGEPRDDGAVARVNDSFLSFPIWAAGDPGLTDITILIPDGFSTDLEGDIDELIPVTRDGQLILEALAIEEPQDFFGQVYGRNDDGLLTRSADLPDGTATVRAWPDDPIWAEFVVDAIEEDVPVIEDLIGLPWPAGDIEVIETVTPYLFGYGGWFNASSGIIEVGDSLERDLILHELSHAWFNDELIGGRWITEGLAEEFASRTIEATGDERPDPDEPDLDDPIRVPLAAWASPWTLDEEDAFGYEQYHYNASWWVIRQITEDIGLEAFSDVLVALAEDELPYRGDGPIEETTQPTRWTHLFDLLEGQAGASNLDELFGAYVLPAVDAAKLEPRRDALAEYDDLVEASGEWSPPLVLRRSMTTWRFADASTLIDDAHDILTVRDEIDALANEMRVTIEHRGEMAFETAANALDLVRVHNAEQELLAELNVLQADRELLVAEAAALETRVEFLPLDYDEAVADVASQRSAIAEVARLRDEVSDGAAALDLDSPSWPVTSGATNFGAAAALAEARLATLAAIGDATTSVHASRSFTQRIGLLAQDPAGALAAARSAFEADDLDDALTETGRAEAMIAQASSRGQNRLTWTVIIFVTLLVAALSYTVIRRRKQNSKSRSTEATHPEQTMSDEPRPERSGETLLASPGEETT